MVGFWFFMLVMVLLVPLTMMFFGKKFLSNPPGKINFSFGYRTTMSMKNIDTWKYAHNFIGRIWMILGLILLPLSVVPMIIVFGRDVDVVGVVGGIIVGLQFIPLLGSIIPVERGLNRNFDKNGNKL